MKTLHLIWINIELSIESKLSFGSKNLTQTQKKNKKNNCLSPSKYPIRFRLGVNLPKFGPLGCEKLQLHLP